MPQRLLKTLDRVLSKAGIGSRTDARSWIGAGRVSVNGKVVQTPDHWVDLERDRVELDGQPVARQEPVYILLYKPAGYLTTYHDPENRPTVYDLIEDAGTWVGPVGRLDLDTSGLLILTNDTDFADYVMSPEGKVPKTYLVKASPHLSDENLAALRHGVQLSDGPTLPAQVHRVRDNASSSFVEITIREGRNRQIRRMIEAAGSRVRKLVRIAIGSLRIGDLQIGTWRFLSPEEVRAFMAPSVKSRSASKAKTSKKAYRKV